MASSFQFERLLTLLALAGVGVGVIIATSFPVSRKRSLAVAVFEKRERVCDFDYLIKEHTSPNKDYITRLPDDILCHIISYLDMKDAVRTSVLSRRWRKLYSTLPNPRFECPKMFEFATLIEHNNCHRNYKERLVTAVHKMFEFVSLTKHNNWHHNYKQRFVTVVDTFLRLRSGLPMESFTLQFGPMREFPGHLQRWLNCIIRFGVRKLDLNFRCNNKLPRVPNSELIVFPFKALLSASMLEYAQLSFCILEPNFQGPSNSLKELILCFVPLVNGETLMISRGGQVNEIGFSAPNLYYFFYYGNCGLSFFPSYVPNLGRLFLDLECLNQPHGFDGFIRGVPYLHTLWIQAIPYQVRYIQTVMPTLWKLHTLSLHVIRESLDLRDIISLFAVCPNLSMFEFSSPLCPLSYTERDAEVPPTCVHLKRAVLDGFKFDAAQQKFVSQLMRCAPSLEEMTIYIAYCLYDFGAEVEKTLPFDRRVFSHELISRTKQQLEHEVSSSSALVNISYTE